LADRKSFTLRITNKANLPEPLVRAVSNDPYDRGDADFTVTELLKPARAHALIHQHKDEIEVDASELIYALTGQIGHLILERAGDPRMVERRFSAPIDTPSGTFKISGRADLWHEVELNDEGEVVEVRERARSAKLSDYKFCSMWAVRDGISHDWTCQVNYLAWLARENGLTINEAEIVTIYRDWSKPIARRKAGDYPPTQSQVFPVELWDHALTGISIAIRIEAMLRAEKQLPLCTDEERWKTPDQWAVKKTGSQRAYKLCDTQSQAVAVAHELEQRSKGVIAIEFRKGEAKRCEDYCMAAPFCEQFQAEKREEAF
jgi:hypothetical protein